MLTLLLTGGQGAGGPFGDEGSFDMGGDGGVPPQPDID